MNERRSPHTQQRTRQAAPAQRGGTELARQDDKLSRLTGTYRVASEANSRMEWAQRNCHLIAPATSVGALPEGCGIAMSLVQVDAALDTYDVGMGKRGLSKSVLQRLASALGVSWDPSASGRLDVASDPYYCRWRAVGQYRSFDGQLQVMHAEKELDLRDGSPTCQALEAQAKRSNRTANGQIREVRAHIQSHAETKAQLRAIRSLGIKTSYTKAELDKPFVAARVMFTGQTDDPELRRVFAAKTADSFLSGSRSLYGGPGSVPMPSIEPKRFAPPPPVGSVPVDDDDFVPEPSQAAPRDTSNGSSSDESPAAASDDDTFVWCIPGGKSKGTPLPEATDRDLQYWSDRVGKELESGQSRDQDRDEALYGALCEEIDRRAGGGSDEDGGKY